MADLHSDVITGAPEAPASVNLAEVRRALEVLATPGHPTELRGFLGRGDLCKTLIAHPENVDRFCKVVVEWQQDQRNVYLCLNPGIIGTQVPRGRGLKDELIARRSWLLIDI